MPRTLDTFSIREMYSLFGIKEAASEAEVNAAYRQLMRRYHPDSRSEKVEQDLEEVAPLFAEMKDILLSGPEGIEAHQNLYRSAGMLNRFRAQFDSYTKWFVRSLELTAVVRSYTRSWISLQQSDNAAKTLLDKLKARTARFEDIQVFALGEGEWTPTSTKTLFFSLLCDLQSLETDKECQEKSLNFARMLLGSGKDLSNNPNVDFDSGLPLETTDYFVNEYCKLSVQIRACEAELMFLKYNLKKEEYDSDETVVEIKNKKLQLVEQRSNSERYREVCNVFKKLAREEDSGVNPASLELRLEVQKLFYRIDCLKGPEASSTSAEEIEAFEGAIDRLNEQIMKIEEEHLQAAAGMGFSSAGR